VAWLLAKLLISQLHFKQLSVSADRRTTFIGKEFMMLTILFDARLCRTWPQDLRHQWEVVHYFALV